MGHKEMFRQAYFSGNLARTATQEYPVGFRFAEKFEVIKYDPPSAKYPAGIYHISEDGLRFPELISGDEIADEVYRQEANLAYRRKMQQQLQEEKEEERKEIEREENTLGFADQFPPRQRRNVINVLNKQRRIGGKFVTLREWIPKMMRKGWYVKPHRELGRVLQEPGGMSFYYQKDLTKIGLDFAQYLSLPANRRLLS